MCTCRPLGGILLMVALPTIAWAQFWCWDADEILAEVEGAAVRIQHLAAYYNCCPDPITYDIYVGDATIMVVENTQSPCDCECCYHLEVTIQDMPPGPWNLLFRWLDMETWTWIDRILQITIPDLGQGYDPYVAQQHRTECLETSAVLEIPESQPTWGALKTMYH